MLGALIRSGVGLTGLLLALAGYQAALAMFGGAVVATVAWMILYRPEGTLVEQHEDMRLAESAYRPEQ